MFRRIFSNKQKLLSLAFVAILGIISIGIIGHAIAETLDKSALSGMRLLRR